MPGTGDTGPAARAKISVFCVHQIVPGTKLGLHQIVPGTKLGHGTKLGSAEMTPPCPRAFFAIILAEDKSRGAEDAG